ncbi:hypothetical protein R1flu_005285 [Riccia fluitans]|uniref:Uncharacterized protein n=1 Tax=Riccia fluitans TaxID=41844 RepID=A0ABD1YSR8_9MARC
MVFALVQILRGKSAFLGSTCCLNRTTTSLVLNVSAQKRPIIMASAEEDAGPVCYFLFTFRTFGVDACGIDPMAQIFIDLGYKTQDELRFPAKKLRALCFSPPEHLYEVDGLYRSF